MRLKYLFLTDGTINRRKLFLFKIERVILHSNNPHTFRTSSTLFQDETHVNLRSSNVCILWKKKNLEKQFLLK